MPVVFAKRKWPTFFTPLTFIIMTKTISSSWLLLVRFGMISLLMHYNESIHKEIKRLVRIIIFFLLEFKAWRSIFIFNLQKNNWRIYIKFRYICNIFWNIILEFKFFSCKFKKWIRKKLLGMDGKILRISAIFKTNFIMEETL